MDKKMLNLFRPLLQSGLVRMGMQLRSTLDREWLRKGPVNCFKLRRIRSC